MSYIDTYKDIGISSEVMGASPWKQVALLLEKLNSNIIVSINALKIKDITLKCKKLTNSYDIVVYLRDCIDFNADNELTTRIDAIYQHLQETIFWANAKNDITKLEHAKTICENLNIWWANANH